MRTIVRIKLDTAASNKAIMDGSLPKIIKATAEKIKPEAAYFYTVDGCRACFMVFDLKDPSEIPMIGEPLFLAFNAQVEFSPVMNQEDLQRGLEAWQKMK